MSKLNWKQTNQTLQEKNLQLFSAKDLMRLFHTSYRATRAFISRYVQSGDIIKVKQNLYYLQHNRPNPYLLANQAYQPSYISLETALSYHHLIPEIVYTITSVTTQATQEFTADNILFQYHKLKAQAFTGYMSRQENGDTFFMATPEKAVADYLYFVSLGKRELNDRLRWDQIQIEKLHHNVKLFNLRPLENLVKKIEKNKKSGVR